MYFYLFVISSDKWINIEPIIWLNEDGKIISAQKYLYQQGG